MKEFWCVSSGGGGMAAKTFCLIFVLTVLASNVSAAKRQQRLIPAAPTPGALKEIAEAIGAATYEELPDISPTGPNKPRNSIDKEQLEDKSIEYQTYQGVVGRPSVDFPVFPSIPQTFFECKNRPTGYYADLETDCQVFHICDEGRKISFLCPNGTIFHQSKLICDWWFKVDCLQSPEQYEESAEHLAEDQRKAEKTKQVNQNYASVQMSSRRSDGNYESGFTLSDNHVTEYRAEASFNSVAKSGAPNSSNSYQQNNNYNSNRISQNARSFQRRPESNSRQQTVNVEENQYDSQKEVTNHRRTTANSYNYASTRRTVPDYTDAAIYRTTTIPPRESKDSRESQVLAETASFASGRSINNYYYSPNPDNRQRTTVAPQTTYTQSPPRTTRPTYTTTYTPGGKTYVEVSRSVTQTVTSSPTSYYTTAPVSYRVASTLSTELKNDNNRILNHRLDASSSPATYTPVKSNFKDNQQYSKDQRLGKNQDLYKTTSNPNESSVKFQNHRYDTPATENTSFYAPSVPTVTPKIYNASTNKFLATNWYAVSDIETTPSTVEVSSISNRIAEPVVAEHAAEMIKTLEELDLEAPTAPSETENPAGRRPGLFVPPSAGPNTLHSLAIYFATAVDNLASTPYPSTDFDQDALTTEKTLEDDEQYTGLLSRNTANGYKNLFKKTDDKNSKPQDVEQNDLESAQSKGPLASSPQIRELAQVFTHALSAYLQDPETFRKILAEIRPTEPTTVQESYTTPSTPLFAQQTSTQSTDYYSVAKEEDEVLDFSDVSKSSPYPTTIPYETTTYPTASETKAFNIDLLKNKLLLSSEIYRNHRPNINSHTLNKTPASNIVTNQNDNEDDSENDIRQAKALSTNPPPTSNNVALEINGGLSDSNKELENRFGEAQTKQNDTSYDTSYFPLDQGQTTQNDFSKYGGFQNNSAENQSPYGEGVRPTDAQPFDVNNYNTSPYTTEPIPIQWGNSDATKIPSYSLNPEVPSYDLIPPSTYDDKQSVTERNYLSFENTTDVVFSTTQDSITETETEKRERNNLKYKSHSADRALYYNNRFKVSNDNDEQLQRAHSQSFISSANQLGRRSKKIESQAKSNENSDENYKPQFNKTYTVRTSSGEIISLPTLKDILSIPTSTAPTQNIKAEYETSPVFSQTSTTVDASPSEVTKLNEPSSTAQYEATTYNNFPKSSTGAQGSTSRYNIWSTSAALGHLWQTTVFLDPMTINNGLTSDSDSETIIPSANTYRSGGLNNLNSNQNIETTVAPLTLSTQEIGTSQYTSYSTPFRINVDDYSTTVAPREVTTYYPTEVNTEEVLQQSQTTYISNGHQDVSRITDPTEYYSSDREGKSLPTLESRSSLEKLNASEVDQTMMIKAKEMFGGLNDSSADTLMNVMKSADKNKTVRRLILLLIQTCDDDHNKTLEASRTALLDALMKIPTDNTEVHDTVVPPTDSSSSFSPSTNSETTLQELYSRKSDEVIETQDTRFSDLSYKSDRKAKNLVLSSSSTTASTTTTEEIVETTTKAEEPSSSTTSEPLYVYTATTTTTEAPVTTTKTTQAPVVSVKTGKRGGRKFYVKSTKTPLNSKTSEDASSYNSAERPSVSSFEDHSVPSDTRALELLRSLYSLAARWG